MATETDATRVAARPVNRLLIAALAAAAVAQQVHYLVSPYHILFIPFIQIGHEVLHGKLPFRDFQFEYPALAALFFVPSALVHSHPESTFAVQGLIAEGLMVWWVFRRDEQAIVRWLVLSFLVSPFLSGGFDGWAMLAIALSTALLADGQAAGWWVAAAGAAVKLSPAGAFVWARTRPRTMLLAGAAAAVATFGPLIVSPGGNADFLGFSLHRGVQAESLPASISILITRLTGHRPSYAIHFRSLEVAGGRYEVEAVALCGLALIGILAWRAKAVDPWLAALVTMLVILCSNKVFSPQYMLWAAPLAVMVGGWWYRGYLVAAALTAAPYLFVSKTVTHVVDFAEVRNLVLVVLAIAGTIAIVRSPATKEASDELRPSS
jgi:hypothetical protein